MSVCLPVFVMCVVCVSADMCHSVSLSNGRVSVKLVCVSCHYTSVYIPPTFGVNVEVDKSFILSHVNDTFVCQKKDDFFLVL